MLRTKTHPAEGKRKCSQLRICLVISRKLIINYTSFPSASWSSFAGETRIVRRTAGKQVRHRRFEKRHFLLRICGACARSQCRREFNWNFADASRKTNKFRDAQYEVMARRERMSGDERIHKRSRSIHVIRMAASEQVCFHSWHLATMPDCSRWKLNRHAHRWVLVLCSYFVGAIVRTFFNYLIAHSPFNGKFSNSGHGTVMRIMNRIMI